MRQFLRVIRNPHFWIVTLMLGIGIIFHYPEYIPLLPLLPPLGLSRHAMERVLFLLPITYAGFMFGMKSGIVCIALTLAIMLPRAIFVSQSPRDALLETGGVIVIGTLVNLWLENYRREKERAQYAMSRLETAQKELHTYIQLIKSNEKRLAALNEVSDVANQSLELQEVLNTTATKVMDIMEVDHSLAFFLDEESQELVLQAYQGVSDEFAAEMKGLKVGEGFNGQVAQTGEPLVVEDVSSDPRLTREVVRREGVKASLMVPLKAKGKVVGTLCVGKRAPRQFTAEDIDLLTHIANHIGVAVENARLYQGQRMMAEQIARDAATEKQMRENLSFYLQQVTRAQEEERRRIARELHDETAQDLTALSRQLDILLSTSDCLSLRDSSQLEELRQQVDRTLDGVRRFSQDLRPSILDDLGLLPALDWLTADVSQYFGLAIDTQVIGKQRRFSQEVELVLFRIAQEALRNVWKHSEASHAWVTIEFKDDETVLTVKDNGKGFELPESIGDLANFGKLGLAGMEERARLVGGTLAVESRPCVGTTVTVVIPAQQV